MKKQFLSFVIPAKNEEESVEILFKEISTILKKINKPYEVIFIDDGSTDYTWDKLKYLQKKNKTIKAIRLRGNFGKSAALQVGFDLAKGDIIFTLDADLQDDPKEIPNLLKKIDEGFDLVSGWKKNRNDKKISKVIPSRIINFLVRKSTGVILHDINCGFKAYRREVATSLNLYGELYRFIPIIASKQNFKVGEVAVNHRARRFGMTKFGWSRGIKGILDLLTIIFLTGYYRRPGHFFGGFGLLCFFSGFLIGIFITYLRLTTGNIQDRQPLLILGLLLMLMGVQLISTGLIAEMIIFNRRIDYSSIIKELL